MTHNREVKQTNVYVYFYVLLEVPVHVIVMRFSVQWSKHHVYVYA